MFGLTNGHAPERLDRESRGPLFLSEPSSTIVCAVQSFDQPGNVLEQDAHSVGTEWAPITRVEAVQMDLDSAQRRRMLSLDGA